MAARRIGMLGTAAAIALVLAGCAPTATSGGQDPRLFGQWKLVGASDVAGAIELPVAPITFTIAANQRPHGRGPCSDYSARVIGSPGPVYVTVTRRSASYCSDTGERSTETRYLQALNATSIASIVRGHLVLTSAHTTLKYAPTAAVDLAAVLDKTWIAQTIVSTRGRTDSEVDAPHDVTLRLASNSSFVVNTLCSSPTGSWAVDAGEVVLSRIQNAGSSCSSLDERDRSMIMRIMSHGVTVRAQGLTLTVSNPRAQETMFLTDAMQ